MRNQRSKKPFLIKIIFSKIFLILSCLILALLFGVVAKKMAQNYSINKEIKNLEMSVAKLEKKNNEFNELINYLNTDRFVEEEARTKLGLRKAGESVIIISSEEGYVADDDNKILKLHSETINKKENIQKNYYLWWQYFIKK